MKQPDITVFCDVMRGSLIDRDFSLKIKAIWSSKMLVPINSSIQCYVREEWLAHISTVEPCYNDISLYDSSFIASDILRYQLIPKSHVYWTVHHLGSWIKIDQLDVTCFIISLFTAQHVSNVSTSIFRRLRLIVDLFHVLYCSGSMCVGVTVWFGWGGVVSLCRLKHCSGSMCVGVTVWFGWGGVVSLCLLDCASSW